MKKLSVFGLVILLVLTLFITVSCSAKDSSDYGGYYGSAADLGDVSGDRYTEIVENPRTDTSENNKSYFSIDANTASYPNLRALINNGYTVDRDAVRVEEMLNYFDYDYERADGEILELTASLFDTPFNTETKLLTVGLAAEEVEFSEVKNNLVFLIDVSGSMFADNKLPLVQQAFMLLTEGLNDTDRVSIVTYAGADAVALDGAYGYEKAKIMAVIEDLDAQGSTAGADGIETAYRIAGNHFIEGGNNRVILATDGDFNVGISNTSELADFIGEKRESGIFFSVYGFGMGNLKADIMETLALNGNGTYGYIDSVKEARRALVTEIGGSIVTVAKDVKAGIEFNTDLVKSFRLIGYENKLLTEEEFNDSATDAGELGSGHTVTVVYEITLRDGVELSALESEEKLADVTVRYKTPSSKESDESLEISFPVTTEDYHEQMTETDAFVASVVEFALLLRDSEYKADASLNALITRLDSLELDDEFKEEFRELVKTYAKSAK